MLGQLDILVSYLVAGFVDVGYTMSGEHSVSGENDKTQTPSQI